MTASCARSTSLPQPFDSTGTKLITGSRSPDSLLTVDKNVDSPMTLLLTQVEKQTHDTKTLRFKVLKGSQFVARPGQFLTFHWTIDGQRVSRSYSISSSPIRED